MIIANARRAKGKHDIKHTSQRKTNAANSLPYASQTPKPYERSYPKLAGSTRSPVRSQGIGPEDYRILDGPGFPFNETTIFAG